MQTIPAPAATAAHATTMRVRLTPLAFAIHMACATLLSASYIGSAQAEAAIAYDIPAGPLAEVLNRFAQQSGVSVVVDADKVQGLRAQGLKGSYGVEEGFNALLKGSGYAISGTAAGYVLVPAPKQPPAPGAMKKSTEAMLPQVEVRAAADDLPGYRVATVRTATKTDTPPLDVAQTVNVVNQELIREQRVIRLADALRNVPGVYAGGSEGRRDQFSIRGFSGEFDMYVDGIRDMAYFRDSANTERIEVLKGPAAVLFGRGSAGGIINRVTKKPTAESVREIQVTGGSWDYRRAEWDLGGAASENVNLRLTGAYEKGGQFRDQLENELGSLAGGVEFKLGPDTTLLATVEWQHHEFMPDRGVPSKDVSISNFYGEPFDFGERDVLNTGLTLEHAFSADTRFKAVVQLNTMDLDAVNTRSTGLSADGSQVKRNTTWFPKERRYAFAQGELTHKTELAGIEHLFLAGYEHGWQQADLKVYQVTAPNISLNNPTYTAPTPVFTAASKTFDVDFTGTTDAVYVQDQMTFSPQWKAIAGVRYDIFDQHQDAGLINKVQSAAIDRTDRKLSPRAGLIYQPTPRNSLYVTGSRSFQPKADDLLFSSASNVNLDPTESKQVELGNKNEFLDGRLAVNAALYHIVMSNIATADPNNSGQSIQVGEQVHRGIEIDVTGEPAPGWRVYGGTTWINAEITKSNDTPEGNRPAGVPRHAANLWLSKDVAPGWRAGVGAYYVGERYATVANTVTLPAYTRWDAAITYSVKTFELALNLRNLTDKEYYESATNNFQLAPGVPRSAMLTARYAF